MVKVNNYPALKNWNGIVNELFSELEKSVTPGLTQTRGIPPVNIVENAEGFHLELLAPGRKKEGFGLAVENNQLTISYSQEKTENPEGVKQIRREFLLGNFKRTFNLDDLIDTGHIAAKYEDGLLKVLLPKRAELKPQTRTIEIQ